MTIYALVPKHSPVLLWGLSSKQRLKRQLEQISNESGPGFRDIRWLESTADLPATGQVLLLNGTFLFDSRTIRRVLDHANCILQFSDNETAAAFVDAGHVQAVLAFIEGSSLNPPKDLKVMQTNEMQAFDLTLSRSTQPLLEPVSPERKSELENNLYGNAYKGITDLVTKFVWPRPAKRFVHLCASLHISPNMVTSFGLLLVVLACYLFYSGQYGLGLLAAWFMTFLDTVDGKLARVTIQSSKFGHLYDHIIDLVHPPFWYIYWGMSLVNFQPVSGQGQEQMYWIIVIAYIAGRIVEGVFPLLGNCGIFTWRPFDAWFRLVTARRNPCLILLSLSAVLGKPEWGFVAVTFWSALTTIILLLRLLQAFFVRIMRGPLNSWLNEDDVASGPNARSYAMFGSTRGAYARK
ncbi:MAG: CDP-alcohol phosphatidyltransferase family protein [Xanthomonadales bacterium]|nr:CDP-alcohol phosphatidyltransferase family protein [Xanthomonadales bacterium]